TITPPGTIIASSVNLRAVRYRFDKAGPYTVNVMAHNVSQQRQIQIAPAPRKSTRQRVATRLQSSDFVTAIVGALLAASAAYLATANADHWGTAGDYLSLATTAFGASSAPLALNTVMAILRGR